MVKRMLHHPFWRGLAAITLTLSLFWALGQPLTSPPPAQAAPDEQPLRVTAPSVSLNVPASAFIGDSFTFTVTFDNTNSVPGYGPLIDLILPTNGADGNQNTNPPLDGLTFVSATYLGAPVESTVLTFPGSGGVTCVNHPYMVDNTGTPVQVCGNAGDTFVAIRLPFGSFTPDQPPATVDVTVAMSNLADLGTPLTIQARGGYQFGSDPLDNPASDDPSATLSAWASGSVTPTLLTLTKTYSGPEDETATGPNFPRQYTVTAQIAPGQTVDNFTLTDTLPANMQFVSLDSTNPSGATCTTPSTTTPGGTLSCDFGSVSGTVSMTFTFYIPLRDDSNASIIDPTSGDEVLSCNNASASGSWTPIDTRDSATTFTEDPSGCEHTLTDKSIAVQKSVTIAVDNGAPGYSPGDVLEYTLNFQVSDFFAFQNVVLQDVVSDGQHVDATFTPTLQINGNGYTLSAAAMNAANYDVTCNYTGGPGSECTADDPAANDGTTTLTFRVSDEVISRGQDGRLIGGCVPTGGTGGGDPDCSIYNDGPTTGTITFRAVVQQNFTDDYPSGDPSVDQGDTLTDDVTITGDLLDVSDATTPTGQSESDTSAASVEISRGALTKSIYAVNGSTSFSTPVHVQPGDTVTFRLQYTLPTSDFENLTISDFLPLPVFDATEVTSFSNTPCGTPAAGSACLGPNDTYHGLPSAVSPSLSTDAANNQLTWTYGNYDSSADTTSTIDLLFTVTVSNEPFADGLLLTNQAHAHEGSTNAGDSTDDAITQIILDEPDLRITKGAVWSDNPNAVFAPSSVGPVSFGGAGCPAFSGTISSNALASQPVNSDITGGVDAGDTIRFAIVIENTGHRAAFDVTVQDSLPSGMTYVAGSLCVTDGAGTPLAYTGDLFTSGIQLTDSGGTGALAPYDANNGRNIAIITFDATLDATIQPGQSFLNTATLTNYANTEGGPNFVPDGLADDATVQTRYAGLGKIFTTEIVDASNSDTQAVIGELVTYTVPLTIPEGQLPNVTLDDTLPDGLAFVDCLSVTPSSSDLTTDLASGSDFSGVCSSNVTVTNSGHNIHFDLGTITNANRDNSVDETLAIQFTAVVLNIAANQSGTTLSNTATLQIDGGAGGTATVHSDALTVIEPHVTTAKSVTPATTDAGNTVSFTVTLTSDGDTTAYDVAWQDTVPSGLTYTSSTLSGSCDIHALTVDDTAAPTLAASVAQLDPGETCTITFDATVDYSVAPGQVITNTATTTWTSLPGDQTTPRSTYNTDSVERTGADGVGGALNDYASEGQATVTVNNTTPQKYLVTTSEAHTGDPGTGTERVTIGEIVRYRLVVQLPEGTSTNFQIWDLLPSGLTFLNDGTAKAAFVSNGTGISSSDYGSLPVPGITDPDCFLTGNTADATTPAIPSTCSPLADGNIGSTADTSTDEDTYTTGADPYFKLGTLVNNDSDPDGEYVILEFNALVDNTATGSNDAGEDRTNSFRVYINGTQNGSDSNGVTVRVAEPSLALDKTVSPTTADAGDTVTYTLTINAASGGVDRATAFDLNLTDTFDAYLTSLTVSSVTTTQGATCVGNGGGTTAFSHSEGFSGNTLTFTATCLDPGQSITLTVTGTLANNTPAGYTLNNTATLTWTSLPGSGTSPNPTGSTTPGGSGDPDGERDGSGGVNDYTDTGNASLQVPVPTLAKSVSPSSYTIGDLVTFNLLVTLPEGETPSMQLVDDLPPGLAYVSHQVITTAAASGGLLSADFNGSFTTSPPTFSCSGACGSGDDITLDFGNTTVAADNDASNNAFLVQVTARVLNESSNDDGVSLTNTATLSWTGGTTSGSANLTIIEPQITTTKSVSPTGGVQAGDTVTYTVRFTNTGNSTAYEVTAVDTLAQGVTYDTGSASCVYNDGSSTSPIGVTVTEGSGTLTFDGSPSGSWDIAPGGYIECTYTATAQNSLILDASHTNTIDADWSSLDGADANERIYDDTGSSPVDGTQDTASATFTSPAPTLTKSDGGVAQTVIGQTVTFTLTLDSPLGTLQNLVVTDTLPAGFIYVTGSQSVGGGISPTPTFSNSSPNDGSAPVTLTWDFGGNAVITSTPITFTYQAIVANVSSNQDGVTLTNQAQATYTDGDGNTATLSVQESSTITEPVLTLTKAADNTTPGYGQTITYTLTVAHNATSTANAFDLVVTDTIPAGLTYVPGSITAPAGWTADDSAAPTLTWTCSGSCFLPLGSTANLGYQATVDAPPSPSAPAPGDVLTNSAYLTWTSLDGSDPNERTGSDGVGGALNDYAAQTSASVTVTAPDLAITKDDGATQYVPGTSVTYTIVVQNLGNGGVTGATVSDAKPAQITSWSWTCTTTGGATCSGSGGPITTDFSDTVDLPAGSSITYTVTATVASSATGDLTNTATVTAPSGVIESDTSNNSASDTDTANPQADLSVTKDDGLTVVAPGATVTYTITVSNAGPSDALGATVSDAKPAQITSWSWTCTTTGGATCSGSGGPITTDFSDTVNLPAGDSITYTVTATVASSATGDLTNTVTVAAPTGVTDPTPADHSASDTDRVLSTGTGDLTKTLVATNQAFTSDPSVAIGEILTYEVTFTVPAGGMLPNLTLTDTLDRGLAFVGCESITASATTITTTLPGGFTDACRPPTNPTVHTEPAGSTNPADAGRQVVFDLGTVSNSDTADGTVTVRYTVVVLDNLENQSGVSLSNSATLTWTGGSLTASAPQVIIQEPDLSLDKAASPTVVLPDEPITFTLTVQHTAQSETDAYDVVVTDPLPDELTYVDASLAVAGPTPTSMGYDPATRTLTVTWDTFPLGAVASITFQATLDTRPGDRVTNEATLAWSSLPGDVSTPQSPYNALSTERFYDPGDPVNAYGVTSAVTVRMALPETGFAPGRVTPLPVQQVPYRDLGDLVLEIPKLGIRLPIVGVPRNEQGWDLTWLWNNVGWLEGTAFPTWAGNTGLTAHNYLPNGQPGPFVHLYDLRWGDQIIIHASGQRYIYEVRDVRLVAPDDASVLRHKDQDWLTLITCRTYDETQQAYRYRVVVQAVLVQVENEP